MADVIATRFVNLRPKTSNFEKEASGGMKGAAKTAAKVFATAFAAEKVFDFAKDAINEAAETQKATEAIKANFGSAGDKVIEFNRDTAAGLGISNTAASEFASHMGLVTANLGLGAKKGAEMTLGLEKLAGATGQIKGVDPAKYFSALQSALVGNTRGLKQMGIAVTPLALKQEALKLGIKGTTSAWTGAQKAQIIYGVATEHLGKLQDQAKAHAGDLANNTIKLSAIFSNMQEEIGTALLPIMTKLAEMFNDHLAIIQTLLPYLIAIVATLASVALATKAVEFSQRAYKAATEAAAAAQAIFNAVMDANPIVLVVGALVLLGIALVVAYKHSATFRDIVNSTWASIKAFVLPIIAWFRQEIPAAWKWIEATAKTVWAAISGHVKTAWNLIKIYVTTGINIIKDVVRIGMALLHGNWAQVWSGLKQLAHDALQGVIAALHQILPGAIKAAGAIGTGIKNAISNALSGIGSGVGSIVRGAINSMIDAANAGVNAIIDHWPDIPGAPGPPFGHNPFGHVYTGTDNWRGGPAWVGEHGKELAFMPRGTQVLPARASREYAQGGGAGTGLHVGGDLIVHTQAQDLNSMLAAIARKAR